MSRALTNGALKFACQRVEDFALVNRVRPQDEKQQAATLWLDYLGVDEALMAQFGEWLNRFMGSGWDGAVLIGFAIGLLVQEYNDAHPEP